MGCMQAKPVPPSYGEKMPSLLGSTTPPDVNKAGSGESVVARAGHLPAAAHKVHHVADAAAHGVHAAAHGVQAAAHGVHHAADAAAHGVQAAAHGAADAAVHGVKTAAHSVHHAADAAAHGVHHAADAAAQGMQAAALGAQHLAGTVAHGVHDSLASGISAAEGAVRRAGGRGAHGGRHLRSEEPPAPAHGWARVLEVLSQPWASCCCCANSQCETNTSTEEMPLVGAAGAAGATAAGVEESNVLGSLVQRLIAHFDTAALGVHVELESVQLDPIYGNIQVHNLTVANPSGYHSPYLLHAEHVVVDIDVERLMLSLGSHVDVQELTFNGVDVIFEKSLTTSNLNDVLKRLSAGHEKAEGSNVKTNGPKLTLHKVQMMNIGAKVATVLTHGLGARMEVGNISYHDFSNEVIGARSFVCLVRMLLMTVIKSVLATVLGRKATESMVGTANRAQHGVTKGLAGAAHKVGGILPGFLHRVTPEAESNAEQHQWWAPCCCPHAVNEREVAVVHGNEQQVQ